MEFWERCFCGVALWGGFTVFRMTAQESRTARQKNREGCLPKAKSETLRSNPAEALPKSNPETAASLSHGCSGADRQ